MLTVGSLFSGIGGIDLGLERAGFEVKWQVENESYCVRVLERHWPNTRRYKDIRVIKSGELEPVDLICGGFPCQDLSVAGKQAGLKESTRSGLWFEMFRIICDLRPRFVLVENVPGLLANHAMGRVLGDLSSVGYDAEWESLPASAFGAPHRRDRVWIVAYSSVWNVAGRIFKSESDWFQIRTTSIPDVWKTWPSILCPSILHRSNDGPSNRVERTESLGNTVVPQVVKWIGERIIKFDNQSKEVSHD